MALTNDTLEQLAATRTVDLTTIGRRTGEPRTVEIWWFHIDGRFIITGTPGRRDWLANIRTDPSVTITAPGITVAGVAVEVTDSEWKRQFFESTPTRWYASQADLDDLVAMAPMVEVTRLALV